MPASGWLNMECTAGHAIIYILAHQRVNVVHLTVTLELAHRAPVQAAVALGGVVHGGESILLSKLALTKTEPRTIMSAVLG